MFRMVYGSCFLIFFILPNRYVMFLDQLLKYSPIQDRGELQEAKEKVEAICKVLLLFSSCPIFSSFIFSLRG